LWAKNVAFQIHYGKYIFELSENCRKNFFLWENFGQKMQKPFILWIFMGKIETLSTHYLLCGKFAVVCWKIASSLTFLKHMPLHRDL